MNYAKKLMSFASYGKTKHKKKPKMKTTKGREKTELDTETLKKNSKNKLQIVLFASMKCPYCQDLIHIWPNMKNHLLANWHMVTRDTHAKLFNEQQIKGVPTVKFFTNGEIHEYKGEKNEEGLLNFANLFYPPTISSLTNLKDLSHTKPSILWCFAPWCGHCKSMISLWNKLIQHKKYAWKACDCTSHAGQAIAETLQVQSFPSIFVFRKGIYHKLDGPRTEENILKFVEENL